VRRPLAEQARCRGGRAPWALAVVIAVIATLAPGAGGQGPAGLPADPLLGFVEIPAGTFVMGSGGEANERWSPGAEDGTVDLPAFYLARRELTVAQFAVFAGATGWSADRRALAAPPDHPVSYVAWTDALAYCRWLEAALKASKDTPPAIASRLTSGWHVTLPTEAQWEKAARGGDRRRYPWGDAPRRDRATFESAGPTPVGALPCPECPYGLDDMSGNVWEWTRSPYQPYPYDESDDRSNLGADALWVIRGGAFGDASALVRTSSRGAAEPGARRAFIGFRLALAAPMAAR
jgi:formylglycine-generating enzyme required for sulfatase activity